MNIHCILTNISGIMFFFGLASIGAIIFIVVHQALKASPFQGPAALILAVCISLLAILAMLDFGESTIVVGRPDATRNYSYELEWVLIPYAVLAVSSLLILALWLLGSLSQHKRNRAKMNRGRDLPWPGGRSPSGHA